MKQIKRLLTILIMIMVMLHTYPVSADTQEILGNANPVLQIVEYQIVEGSVELTSEFHVQVTVKNNNAFATAYNVTCSVATEEVGLKLADGEVSQNYFQSIAPNEKIKFTKKFYLDKNYPHDNAKIAFTFDYTAANGKEYKNTTYISPGIKEACKLKITGLSVASTATLDSRAMITVKCENDGELNISNLSMNIEGDILEGQKTNYLGDIKSGEELNKNIYINFNKVGKQVIKISFTYNDEAGNEYKVEGTEYTIDVVLKNSTSVTSSSSDDSGVGGKMIVVMVVLVIVIIYFIMKLLNSMKKGAKK